MSKGRQDQKEQDETSKNKETYRKTALKIEAMAVRTLIKLGDVRRSGGVSMSCFASDTRRIAHKSVKADGCEDY